MSDIVPELLKAIETDFQSMMMKDRNILAITKRIRDGTAKSADIHAYSARAGELLSKSLKNNMTPDALPDGRLYWNIADRIVRPTLQNNYNLVNDIATDVQKIVDAKGGIGLGTVKADFPDLRIKDLIEKMVEDEDFAKWLGEPIINNSEAFADDFMRANASARDEVGLKTYIVRTSEYRACEWCENLAGRYEYGHEPDEVYARHEFCRCSVTFESEKGRQNVWTKKWYG